MADQKCGVPLRSLSNICVGMTTLRLLAASVRAQTTEEVPDSKADTNASVMGKKIGKQKQKLPRKKNTRVEDMRTRAVDWRKHA